jgi:adenine-specific DNA-methyltransferase
MAEQDFIKAGFTVVGTENNENKLLRFLKENYPNVIRDTEINLEELKTVLGLPIDEKVNGYGLNFVGRNFVRIIWWVYINTVYLSAVMIFKNF